MQLSIHTIPCYLGMLMMKLIKVYCCDAVYGFLKLFTYIIFGYVLIYITLYFINYNRATKTSIQIIFEAISFTNKKKYYQGVKRICTGSIMTIYSPEYDVNIILPAFYNHRLRLYIYWITPQILKFAWPFWSFLSLQECMFHPSALSRSDNVQT